jgi:SAM-dependent methyltransferase
MKEFLKKILKTTGLYYSLQGFYRHRLSVARHRKIKREFARYKGSGFTCNICGARYEKFAPDHPFQENADALQHYAVVAGYGENIFCPDCMSTSRQRLVIAMLGKMKLDGLSALHFSPEKIVFDFLKSKATVITADLTPGFYRRADKKVLQADATQLSYPDQSFNLVIANHILEHIPDDRKAMREINRVLKKGGQAILQVPFSTLLPTTLEEPLINNPKEQSRLFGQKDHVRIYQLNDYLKRLEDSGFLVDYIPYDTLTELYPFAIQPGEGFISIKKK